MARIDYAERNGLIPVVDMDSQLFSEYFRLKNEISIHDVYKNKNVLLSGWNSKPVYPGWCNWMNLDFNEEKKVLLDKYIDYADSIKELVAEQRLYIQPEMCLGLYLRGTDYIALKPSGHPIQPSFSEVKPIIDIYLKCDAIKYIFLVTEDQEIMELVNNSYQGIVRTVTKDQYWSQYDGKRLIMETIRKHGSVKANNLLYIAKIMLLSECHSFIGGRTNGSSVACGMNGGRYVQKYVYDKGLYP